jgi:UDP-N-acetylmuramoylalanine--D-glutamate ligase
VGDHNAENVLTAAAALLPYGIADLADPTARVRAFEAPPHRVEHVRTVGGVDVYDDSKATNVHAALAGLSAFGARPVVAIVGGVDKGLDLAPLLEALRTRTRRTVVIGELRARFVLEASRLGLDALEAETLAQAVELAMGAAQPGDAVVLSPACSSFDMFSSYADRGRQFQALVRAFAP